MTRKTYSRHWHDTSLSIPGAVTRHIPSIFKLHASGVSYTRYQYTSHWHDIEICMRSRTSGHTSSIPGLHHEYPTSTDRFLNAVLSFTRLVKLQVAKLKLDSETYFKLEYQLVTVTPGHVGQSSSSESLLLAARENGCHSGWQWPGRPPGPA